MNVELRLKSRLVWFHFAKVSFGFVSQSTVSRCVANLHFECQELKPKGEANSSFLVLYPSSGVHTVKTLGSHLKLGLLKPKRVLRLCDS